MAFQLQTKKPRPPVLRCGAWLPPYECIHLISLQIPLDKPAAFRYHSRMVNVIVDGGTWGWNLRVNGLFIYDFEMKHDADETADRLRKALGLDSNEKPQEPVHSGPRC